MSIIDAPPSPALTATATDLRSVETPAPDYFAVGRDVWVPSRACRARITEALVGSHEHSSVHTTIGYVSREAMPLPMPGETLRGGSFFVGWAKPGDASDLTGLTTGGMALTRVVKDDPAQWDARDILDPTDTTGLELGTALALLCEENVTSEAAKADVTARLATARQEGRQEAETIAHRHLNALVSRAHEWADLHDLCEKFDEFCSDNNLREREREYEVTVHVTLSVPVSLTVKARDEVVDTFNDNYDEDDIWRMIRDQDIDPSDVTAYDVEVRDYNRV